MARSSRRAHRVPDRRITAVGVAFVAFATLSACTPDVQPSASLSLSCGNGPAFLPNDLRKPATDPGSDPVGLALAAFLSSREATFAQLPRESWTRVAETEDSVLFLAPSVIPDAPFAMVAMTLANSGWTAEAWGGCQPAVRSGRSLPATWTLAAPAGPDATSLDVWIQPTTCADGHPVIDRLLPPIVTYGDAAITVTFQVATAQPDGQVVACPADHPIRTSVSLVEAVGGRTLLDGGMYPPKPVEVGAAP